MGLALTNIAIPLQQTAKIRWCQEEDGCMGEGNRKSPSQTFLRENILLETSDAYFGKKNVSTKPLLGWPQAEGNPGQPKLHAGDQSLETGGQR